MDDHNLWNYMFYISYVMSKKETEYTGIESYVRQCIDNNLISWFPIGKSYKVEIERMKEK
jgi:inositol 1,4,5-triphosphate receptor type 1/inositol 1,4,5-triphosphate receptor type 3